MKCMKSRIAFWDAAVSKISKGQTFLLSGEAYVLILHIVGPLTFIYFISFKKCFLLCVFGCQFRFTALFFLVPLQFEQQHSHSPHAVQCCSQDCLVKPGVYSQTMSIMPGPVDPLQGRFEAFLPLGRHQTRSLINTRGVWPNILLDSQSRRAGISFALGLCIFVCVYACWGKVGSLQKTEEMKVCTEQSLAVHFAFVGIIHSLHIDRCGTCSLRRSDCRWKRLCSALRRKLPALLLSHPSAAR